MKLAPGSMSSDEYQIAEKLKDAIVGDKNEAYSLGIVQGVNMNTRWGDLATILKKPIFGFLNNEIVKQSKLLVMTKKEAAEEIMSN